MPMMDISSKPDYLISSTSPPPRRASPVSKRLIAFVVSLGILTVVLVILQFCFRSNSSSQEQAIKASNTPCSGDCTITLVESIPVDVKFPVGSITNPSIYNGWMNLLKIAEQEIDIASFYWTLKGSDTNTTDASTKQGEDVFEGLEAAAKRGKNVVLSFVNVNLITADHRIDIQASMSEFISGGFRPSGSFGHKGYFNF